MAAFSRAHPKWKWEVAAPDAERRRMMGTRKKRQDDVVVAHGDDESVPSRAIARDV